MNIQIIRPPISGDAQTISPMYIDGILFCYVLEDQDRDLYSSDPAKIKALKIKHKTAIPYGRYEVVMSFSERFQKMLPLLLAVPGFDGIRAHSGTTEADTSGCLLLGQKGERKIINSRETVRKFIVLLMAAIKRQKVFIEILPCQPSN